MRDLVIYIGTPTGRFGAEPDIRAASGPTNTAPWQTIEALDLSEIELRVLAGARLIDDCQQQITGISREALVRDARKVSSPTNVNAYDYQRHNKVKKK